MMTSPPIFSTLSDLGSSKTRERNNALDELTSILKQSPDLIPTKTLASTCETLIELLDSEYRKYCLLITTSDANSGKLSLSENRLSLVAYVLRLFIEKTSSRLKARTMKLLLAVLPELMVKEGSKTLIEPISVHLTFALYALIGSKLFQLKMLLHQWVSLVEVVCSYLIERFPSFTDRNVSNLILILHRLLTIDCIGLSQVRQIIYRTLLDYLRQSQKHNVNTKPVLCMVNEVILKTHCSNIMDTLCLIKETWKHVLAINVSASEPIQNELSYLDIFASELIVHNLPTMVGGEEALSACSGASLYGICREYLISRLTGCKASWLTVDCLRFSTNIDDKVSFFELKDFQLKETADIHPWLRIMSITKLTISYFKLLQMDGPEPNLFKRHKCDSSFSSVLRDSQSMASFLVNGLNADDADIQLICLQMAAFAATLQDFKANETQELKTAVEQKFENAQLIKWACLTLIPLYSQSEPVQTEVSWNRILKLCFPLIKQPALCRVSCTLLSIIIKLSNCEALDKATVSQIFSVYELSDVNGPGLPCNEAFELWQNLQTCSLQIDQLPMEFTSRKIMNWIEAKWQQIILLQENQDDFCEFIAWLCNRKQYGSQAYGSTSFRTFNWQGSWQDRYLLWTNQLEERLFILQVDPEKQMLDVQSPQVDFDNVAADRVSLNDILYRLLELIEGKNQLPPLTKLQWIFQVTRLASYFSGDSQYVNYLLDFKKAASTVLHDINLVDKREYEIFFRCVLCLRAPTVAHLIFEELPIERIITEYKKVLPLGYETQRRSDMPEFNISFDRDNPNTQMDNSQNSINPFVQPLVGLSLESYLSVLRCRAGSTSQEAMDFILEFLKGLEAEDFISCLKPVTSWIRDRNEDLNCETHCFLLFTEILSEYLLQSDYNTSSVGAYYLCAFLDSVSAMWLKDSGSSLNADCNDIFDWLISRFEDTSISGTITVKRLSELLLSLLKNHDLSRGYIKGGKQRVFAAYAKSLRAVNVADVVCELPNIADYMMKISSKNQQILFSEICSLFAVPQQSIEMSAVYSLAMCKISSASYLNMSLAIRDALRYTRFEHTRIYIASAFQKMTLSAGLSGITQLFDIFKLEILSLWFEESFRSGQKLEDLCDIEIFGFHDWHHFFQLYIAEISALYFSRAQKPDVLALLTSSTGESERRLFLKYYYLILPLSFVPGGQEEELYAFSRNLTGNAFRKLKNQALLFRWILRFVDLGSNYETSTLLEKTDGSSANAQILYPPHADTTRYQYPLHIPLGRGLMLLRQLMEEHPFCTHEINFILLFILRDLEKSLHFSDKLKCLRELKLALALNDKNLANCKFLPTFLPPLSKCLTFLELHNETADIITFILKTCREQNLNIVDEFIPLFCELFLFKRKFHKEISSSLKEILDWLATSVSTLQKTVKFCNDAIQGEILGYEVYADIEILDNDDCSIDRIILLSLLFGYAQKPKHSLCLIEPSVRSARNLLKHEIPSHLVTENFQLWLAYYLKEFNSKNDLRTVFSCSEFSSDIYYDKLFVNFGSLEHIFEEFLDVSCTSPNSALCTVRLFCASLTCLFVCGESYDDEKVFLGKKQVYESCQRHCLLLNDLEFWSIHKEERVAPDMRLFITQSYVRQDISYSEWLLSFDSALLRHLTPRFPKLKLYQPLCRVSPIFAQRVLPILFNLAVCFDHRAVVDWTEALFSRIGDVVVSSDSKRKVDSMLNIMDMLMSGKRLKEPFCTSCCSVLPLKSIYEAALESGQVRSAYMIFELLYMDDLSNLDHNALSTIYEALDEVDLFAGLPAPQTLMEALESATKIEPRAQRTFLLNNAMVDAQFLYNGDSGTANLLKTSEYQGLYGIATCLSQTLPASGDTLCEYRWALQLGNWDLPMPKVVNSKERGLYLALRRVSSGVSQPSKVLEDIMVELVKNKSAFNKKVEWAETLAEVAILKQMTEDMKSKKGMVAFLQSCFALDKKALHTCDFSDYKSNTQARFLLSRLLVEKDIKAQFTSSLDLKMCSAALLANNVELAVRERSSQDALRNAIVLDCLSQQEGSSSFYRRLRSYVSATALWAKGDSKTPVVLLQNLLDETSQEIESDPLQSLLSVSNDEIRALLVNWTSKSRLETPSTIFEKYIKDFEITVKDHDVRADTFNILANFLNSQVKKMKDSGEVEERQKRCDRGTQESRALEAIQKKTDLSNNERKDARRHYNRVLLQLNSDREILSTLLVQRVQFVWRALHYFVNTLVFTNRYDGDVLDKFCGLWFEHDGDDTINSLLNKEIGMIPSWKFLPWVNQIASRLSIEDREFQKPLQLTMKRLLYKLPYDSLYSVLSMKLYENHSFTNDSIIPQKIKAVDRIFSELQGYDSGSYNRNYVLPLKEFCEMSVELANLQPAVNSKSTRKIQLQNLKMGSYWLKRLPGQQLPLPTLKWPINASRDGKAPRPYITSVEEMVDISVTGLSLPKIVTFNISDGSQHKVLMKGSNDDLRQDAIMEQVFQQVNSILQREKRMRKLNLTINTYIVIPLGPRAGIIEFVTNSLSLHQILTSLHRKDKVSFNEARTEMKKVQTKSNQERLEIYLKLTREIKPQLRHFFFDSFPDSNSWFTAKKTYIKGIATTSMVGYVLGLGDRHLNNILLNHHTGQPTHIDLGIAFDQGRLLPIPEMIPFRLTRDIVDGFGVTGVEGLFRRSCEHTYSVLRGNYEKVMHVLNILKWDPLYSWEMSPVKKHKHLLEGESQEYNSLSFDSDRANIHSKSKEQNQESYRALKTVEEKLVGNGLSVEATVQELIQEASDPHNLSLIYMGWSPFY